MIMKRFIAIVVIALLSSASQAQVEIDINTGQTRGIAIAVVPFATTAQLPHQIHEVITNDLRASGKFDPIDQNRFLSFPSREEDVRFKDWEIAGAEALVIGDIQPLQTGNFQVTFLFYDMATKRRVGGFRYTANTEQLREVAHEISDYIYKELTGKLGAFSAKIAFVRKAGKQSQLQVSDWDGYGARTIVTTSQPILSPAWSPNGREIAFVTYQGGNSVIKIIDLSTGATRTAVSSRKGFNSAPAWSPDGNRLAFASSRTGNSEIYVQNLITGSVQKLTNHWNIDTEPTWSADGSRILFSSGRSGKPNIYEMSAQGGSAQRISFEGKENSGAVYSPTDRNVVLVSDGKVTVMDRTKNRLLTLSNSSLDESPGFSPNGDMVLYATKQGYNGRLVVSSVDGRATQTLNFLSGDVRDPSWSPYNRKQ